MPHDEAARLAALHAYGVLDSAPEPAFDRITRLTAEVLGVPVAIVHLVDQERLWPKSCFGIAGAEVPRGDSMCAWTILQEGVLVVPQASADPRFAHHPSVTGAPNVHLYAGAPLVAPGGERIGTLCVIDDRPHDFGPREQHILQALAALVVDELELRRREAELRAEAQFAQTLLDISRLTGQDLPAGDLAVQAVDVLSGAMPLDWGGLIVADRAGARLLRGWSAGPQSGDFEQVLSGGLPRGKGRMWAAFDRREPVFVGDYAQPNSAQQDGAQRPGAVPALVRAGMRAGAWLHLHDQANRQYVLAVVRLGEPRPWTPRERELLAAAARSLRVALERQWRLHQMERAAHTDALTTLGNRRAFEQALHLSEQRGTPYSVGLIDLNGMKRVNDTHGHARGDALLRTFAEALQANVRGGDQVFRLGGDEYALLCGHAGFAGPPDEVERAIRRRVAAAVQATRAQDFGEFGAAFGWAYSGGGSVGGAELLRLADERMYAEKRSGGRRAVDLA